MKILFTAVVLFFSSMLSPVFAKTEKVPGIVVNYVAASSGTYIGSPSIVILPNGDYVASHDFFGPASTEHRQALTAVFSSADKGKSWKKIAKINGQFWSNLFVHKQELYIMGTWKHSGNLILRKSPDGGKSWSEPADSKHGLLREGEYHTAPMPMVIHNGRLCRAIEKSSQSTASGGRIYEAIIISAPLEADLMDASNWTTTNYHLYDSSYLNGKFGGWIEGNAVVTPEGQLIDFLRVETKEPGRDLAAIVTFSEDGKTASFDTKTGFLEFAGGAKKFTIRYDEISKRYWAVTNQVSPEFASMPAGKVRNTLVLQSSPDLRSWTVHQVLLHHPDVLKHGFQYVDWQFEGENIIFLSRTAYDDAFGGADDYHNANYLTFHRINGFRKLALK
ncbi:MAG TPA: sialidase family protein [Prolixibacteraceae bacterium]|nr:sialidase family protein [Prolixibacteraceae bacterium]